MSLSGRVSIADRAHKHSDDRYRITEQGNPSVDECGQVFNHVDGPLVPAADFLNIRSQRCQTERGHQAYLHDFIYFRLPPKVLPADLFLRYLGGPRTLIYGALQLAICDAGSNIEYATLRNRVCGNILHV